MARTLHVWLATAQGIYSPSPNTGWLILLRPGGASQDRKFSGLQWMAAVGWGEAAC